MEVMARTVLKMCPGCQHSSVINSTLEKCSNTKYRCDSSPHPHTHTPHHIHTHITYIHTNKHTTLQHHTDKHTHTYIPANGQVSRVPKAMQADTLYGFWDRQSFIHSWKCLDENVLVAWGKTESKIQTMTDMLWSYSPL